MAEQEPTLVFRSGKVIFEWVERANVIVLEHDASGGNGLTIEPPPGLKFELEAFTLWACEFLGMLMADQPTFTAVSEPTARGDEDDSFSVALTGPIEALPQGTVLAPIPEAWLSPEPPTGVGGST
jgi:hypothetical protein